MTNSAVLPSVASTVVFRIVKPMLLHSGQRLVLLCIYAVEYFIVVTVWFTTTFHATELLKVGSVCDYSDANRVVPIRQANKIGSV